MEDFSNKENYRGYRIWNMGWQDGDVELIMTVLSKKFKLMNTSERENQPSVAVNKDLFPWAYAKFRDQMEANGGPAASDNSYRKRKKTIFKEVSFTITVGFTCTITITFTFMLIPSLSL